MTKKMPGRLARLKPGIHLTTVNSMKYKPMPTQEFLNECFLYDENSGQLIWKKRPLSHFKNLCSCNSQNSRFAGKPAGNIVTSKRGKPYLAVEISPFGSFKNHRIIWKLKTGLDPIVQIDHENGETLDNRFFNLREASVSQNQFNRGRQKNSKSGFKGVNARKDGGYVARISFHGERKYLGYFNTAEQAFEAYRAESAIMHKEFANHG